MRLKKIKIAGFKSFVDPTTVNLPGNLTGIVGPNGCGKSNVIDAVRWVLGESSAKHLRGDSMADVIFSGSNTRKPVGQAVVELLFDNSEGVLGGQYAAYSEISVKRQVSRDGQSVYFLNGTRCRRRDIADVFLGTGLGARSYAIIEQGTISRLVEAKPEELRVFLEEAAGISKYKERRRETESRMRATNENLARLNDICEELEKRLQTLQRQAKTAEKYQEFKEQERQLKAQLLALRWRALTLEGEAAQKNVLACETDFEKRMADVRHAETLSENLRVQQQAAQEHHTAAQGEYYATAAEIARLEQAQQHARQTRRQQEDELARVTQQETRIRQQITEDTQHLAALRHQCAEKETALAAMRAAELASSTLLQDAERSMQQWQHTWDDFNTQANATVRAADVERAKIHHLEQAITQHAMRLTRQEEEHGRLDTRELMQDISALEGRQSALQEQLSNVQSELEQCIKALNAEREQQKNLTQALHETRGKLQAAQGRQSSLETYQQQALGKRTGAVVTWLKQCGLDSAQRLAETLTVQPGWERAVEHVLGLHLEAVCVTGLDAVAGALDRLTHGKLAVFDTQAEPALAAAHSSPRLIDYIQAPWSLQGLLDGIYCAPDLATAIALRATLNAHESVVTPEGVWLGRSWLRAIRENDEKSGVIAREQELRNLNHAIGTLQQQVTEINEKTQESAQRLRAHEQRRDEAQRELNRYNQQRIDLAAQLGGRRAKLEQMQTRATRLATEMEETRAHSLRDEQEIAAARQRLHTTLQQAESQAEQRAALVTERDTHRAHLEELRARARSDREALHQTALQLQADKSDLLATQERLQRLTVQLQQLVTQCGELNTALNAASTPLEQIASDLAAQLQRRLTVEAALTAARGAAEEIEQALRAAHEQRQAHDQAAQKMRGELEKMRLRVHEISTRAATLAEQIDEANYVREELIAQLPPTANEAEWQAHVERITQQIQRLGAINLAAIEEFKEHSMRKTYLDAQHADLCEALATLETAIRKIDRETRDRFKDTFDKVNSGLQAMFPRLFGGGHAYLELTGEDLLDTGVTVMARPPGKRNTTIHLLSGGEKALTAVAMVFAIFELNPAPFCMLDEVDAPLDEANVGRFCALVKEMSRRIQFIYITHNKASMEMASHLSGVTMHEPGVSRLVTVDVEEAAQMAAVG